MVSSHLKSGKLYFTSLRMERLHKLVGKFLQGRLVFPIYLLILIWTHGYLFYIFGYKPILFSLFCCLDCSSFTLGSSFSWLLDTTDTLSLLLLLLVHSDFLSPPDAADSSCVIPASVSVIGSMISLRGPVSFHWRIVFESKMYILCMFLVTGWLLLLVPFS